MLLAQLEAERPPVPKLAICIMIAGTRGDVQPFIALGLKLKVRHGSCRRLQIGCNLQATSHQAPSRGVSLLQPWLRLRQGLTVDPTVCGALSWQGCPT